MDQALRRVRIATLTADAGYDSEALHTYARGQRRSAHADSAADRSSDEKTFLVSVRPVRGGWPMETGLPCVGTAMSAAGSGASGFGSGLVEAVGENGLGMRRGPPVRQHLFQSGIVRM